MADETPKEKIVTGIIVAVVGLILTFSYQEFGKWRDNNERVEREKLSISRTFYDKVDSWITIRANFHRKAIQLFNIKNGARDSLGRTANQFHQEYLQLQGLSA